MNGLDIVIFELAGKPVLLIDLVSSVLGLTCVFLAGRNSKYNFWVGYLYTTALFLLFWNKNLYASLLLQPISLAINVLGHWRWTHPRENEQSAGDPTALKVSMLSWTERFFAIGSVFLIVFFIFFVFVFFVVIRFFFIVIVCFALHCCRLRSTTLYLAGCAACQRNGSRSYRASCKKDQKFFVHVINLPLDLILSFRNG